MINSIDHAIEHVEQNILDHLEEMAWRNGDDPLDGEVFVDDVEALKWVIRMARVGIAWNDDFIRGAITRVVEDAGKSSGDQAPLVKR